MQPTIRLQYSRWYSNFLIVLEIFRNTGRTDNPFGTKYTSFTSFQVPAEYIRIVMKKDEKLNVCLKAS